MRITRGGLLKKTDADGTYPQRRAGTTTVAATLPFVNVRDYGAVGDGVTDDTAAIQAALTYANSLGSNTVAPFVGPSVYFPYGIYNVTSNLGWGFCSIVGDTERASFIYWSGDPTGTAITSLNGLVHKQMVDIAFRSATVASAPTYWVDVSSGICDWGGRFHRVSFPAVSSATGAAVKTAGVVNAHWRDIRFDCYNGYGIEISTSSGQRSFSLDGFTFATGGSSVVKGIVHVIVADAATQLGIELSNARIESTNNSWASGGALVVVDETTPGTMGTRPLDVNYRNLQAIVGTQANPPAMLRQNTTNTGVGSQLVVTNCELPNFATLTGTWSAGVIIPQLPTGGQIALWVTGRQNSGATVKNWVLVPRLAIGSDDTDLYRDSAGVLRTSGALTVDGNILSNGLRVGGYYGAPFHAATWLYPPVQASTLALTLNRLYYIPINLPTGVGSLTEIDLDVTTFSATSSGGLLRYGLYADLNGLPTGAPLVDAGTISSETTNGLRAITISQAFTGTRVHLAVVAQGTTCTVRCTTGVSPWALCLIANNGVSPNNYGGYYDNTNSSVTGALPTAGSSFTSAQVPFAGVKVA